jgi:hypothetical protein
VSEFVKPSLSDFQHGFRKKRSCSTQLLGVFHDIGEALDNGKEADMIYLDFSKAFDSVSDPKLLLKVPVQRKNGSTFSVWIRYFTM